MTKQLVVLESPSKVPKVQKFLGNNFIVVSSKGHLRDLDSKKLSIDINNDFEPNYIVSDSKKYVIGDLKTKAKLCDVVWLATDYDREGESIAWHISEILKLTPKKRKRMLFTEITKKAILKSMDEPQDIDMNMFYAQQARRILDRLIGYLISPLLWSHIQNSTKKKLSLSAGRVQSVVLRLVTEREKEIEKFSSQQYFKTNGLFVSSKNTQLKGDLDTNIESSEDNLDFLEYCKECKYVVHDVKSKKTTRKPSAPFTTSTLQQDASNRFKMSPKVTMRVAQTLYESGHITYMRTDSVILSEDALQMIGDEIKSNYGDNYLNITHYKGKSKNSQEAHEACRPCKMSLHNLNDDESMDNNCKKLYKLIWNRTIASQMAPAKVTILTTKINVGESEYKFISKQETLDFDGYQRIYKANIEDNDSDSDNEVTDKIIKLNVGDEVNYNTINSIQKFSKPPHARYTEASLVKKLDDLGIGRPSTYSSMVSLIQDRNYVEKKDLPGVEKDYSIYKLENNKLDEKIGKTKIGGDKQKLIPNNIGNIVVDFLMKHFSEIMDYEFTASIENKLDNISTGGDNWVDVVRYFYNIFNPKITLVKSLSSKEKDRYERLLGIDPNTKLEVYTYIAKYGPVVQLRNPNGEHKFAPLKDIKMNNVKLDYALELLKYPKELGEYKNKKIILNTGKFGKYLKFNNKNYSILENKDIDLNDAITIIVNTSNKPKESNILKTINKDIIIKTGKFGNYISYKNKFNVALYNKDYNKLNAEECMVLIKQKKMKSQNKK